MPHISDAIQKLWMNKDDFSKLYKKVMDKALTSKVTIISDENLDQIKKLIKKSPEKKKLPWSVDKPDASHKVLKSNEFKEKSWFLSGLWFMSKEDEVEEEETVEEVYEKPKQQIERKPSVSFKNNEIPDVKKEDFFNSLTSKPAEKIDNNRQKNVLQWHVSENKWPLSNTNTHARQNARPRYNQSQNRNKWNIQIGQNTRKDIPKKEFVPSASFRPSTSSSVPARPFVSSNNYVASNQNRNFNSGSSQQYNRFPQRTTPVPVQNLPKREKIAKLSDNLVKKKEIIVDKAITVKEFSEKMWIPLPEVMKVLLTNKIMVWITSSLDFDTASLVAWELWIVLKKPENKLSMENILSWNLQAILDLDKWIENIQIRPPVVTVMWHVDHGKTTLLDYLRKTVVANWEAWWITQSIWASVVEHDWQKITFIDTPWHELFTSLRARWAKITNVAVIVVAADDSVMPQTIESISHAKESWVPIIIAITKIDKPWNKNIEQIKSDVARYWLTPEDRWGETPFIWVSWVTWQWVNDLLDAILLQAEILELRYNPNRSAVWVVVDAYKDPKQWIVTTIIIMTWTLKLSDIIVASNTYGKVRRMQNWKWQTVVKATWWEPIQILWFTKLPEPGSIVEVVKNEKIAQEKISLINDQENSGKNISVVQSFISQLQSGKDEVSELRLILKADWSSSLEALKKAVETIVLPPKVTIKVVHSDAGHFSDSDLSLAQATSALLLWFNVNLNTNLKKKADMLKLRMKNFDIIYELTDYISKLTQWMIKYDMIEVILWKLNVLGIFFRKWKEMVIWWRVIEWKVKNNINFRILKWEEIIGDGNIISLQKEQTVAKEVLEWHDCGMKIRSSKKIVEWDILEFYEMQEDRPENEKK